MIVEFKYHEYLDIDRDFQAVFNEEVDRSNKNLWKTFIPHESFLKFLDITLKALQREKQSESKSIWLYGAYGTGKTHAVLVLKHLFEDSDEEINSYFGKFSDLIPKNVVEKIRGLRKQNILVVFRSSAGHVNSAVKLLLEVQQSIYNSYIDFLERNGLRYELTKTEIQKLLERLGNETINWDKLIEKHANKLFDVSSVEDIKAKLERSDVEFATRLLDVLIEEGIVPIRSIDIRELKEWIKEIIAKGKISKILFIWDEFSEFFRSDSPISTLQELAHLTQEVPFYLLLVTHRHPEHWSDTLSKDIEKLKDRFHTVYYGMEPITVYKLVSQVIKIRPEKIEKWRALFDDISFLVSKFGFEEEIYKIAEKEQDVSIKELRSVVPIHPYTIYLASRIAEYFGSANRTIFKFLKEREGFVKFLHDYPQEKEFLLTPDFLWDFFFVKNEDILLNDTRLTSLMSLWREYEPKLDPHELRIFKVIMILFAIKERGLSDQSLLNTSLNTLKVAFSGTPVYTNLEETLSKLEEKRAVKLMRSFRDIEILKPSYDVDSEEIERIKKDINFKEFVKEKIEFEGEFSSLRRAKVFVVTSQDISKGLQIITKPYEIPIVIVLLEKLEGLTKLIDKVREMAKYNPGTIFALSKAEIGENWLKIIENQAYYKYYLNANKIADARYHEGLVNRYVKEWKDRIRQGEFRILVQFDSELLEDVVIGFDGLKRVFNNFFEKKFPYAYQLERMIMKEALWTNRNLNRKSIELGLNLKKLEDKKKYGALRPFREIFCENEMIIDEEGNFIESQFESKKNHPLAVMREKIRELYQTNGKTIDLKNAWEALQKPPFGLYDCPVGCFVFALIMREYCRGHFAVEKNGLELELNYDNMADILNDVIKETREWKIQTISKEQKEFCEFLNRAFYLNANTPIDAIKHLREKVKSEIKYPLWILKFMLKDDIRKDVAEAMDILIDLLDIIVKSPLDKYNLEDLNKNIKEFAKTLNSLDSWEKKELIENFRSLTGKPLESFKSFVARFFSNIGFDIPIENIDKTLRRRMQEDAWLWEREKVENTLKKMVFECNFVNNFGKMTGIEGYFLEDLREKYKEKIKCGDFLPLWLFKYRIKDADTRSKFKEIENVLCNENKKPFEIDFSKLDCSNIADIITDKEIALENWLTSKFGECDEQIIENLKLEFKNLISADPTISEEEATIRLQEKLKTIELKLLRTEIIKKTREIFECEDFKEFVRSKQIPIPLIKYLPEFQGFKSQRSFDTFIGDLGHLENLSKEGLKTVLREIEENREILKLLLDPNIGKKALRAFLGKSWVGKLFNDSDLVDFLIHLKQKFWDPTKWSEKSVSEAYEEWKKEKYMQRFYPRISEFLDKLESEKIRKLIKELSEDPDIGFKIMELGIQEYE